jgi:hypothetical protein
MADYELREIYSNADATSAAIGYALERLAQKFRWEPYFLKFLQTYFSRSVPTIFDNAESPIERYLWSATLMSGVFSNNFIDFWPPLDTACRLEICENLGSIGFGKLMYSKSPARKHCSFYEYMARCKDGSTEDFERWNAQSFLTFDIGLLFSPVVMLQPSLRLRGKTIRPDAMAFIPAFPDNCVFIECDGFEFHSSRDAFTSDRKRDRLISDAFGVEVRRYSGPEVFASPVDAGNDLFDHLVNRFGTQQAVRKRWITEKTVWARTERRKLGVTSNAQ